MMILIEDLTDVTLAIEEVMKVIIVKEVMSCDVLPVSMFFGTL